LIISLVLSSLGTTIIYHKSQRADIGYFRAHRLFEEGDYKKAIPLYEEAIARKTSRGNAYKELGYSYQWSGSNRKAIETFRKAIALYPEDYQLKKALAQTLSWQGEYKESIKLYEETALVFDDFETQKDLAQVYIWDKQFAKSEAILDRLLNIKPGNLDLMLLLAKLKLYSGRREEAKVILKQLSLRDDADADSQILYGQALLFSGNYQEAGDVFEGILAKNPNDYTAMGYLADSYAYTGFYKEAEILYSQVIKSKDNLEYRRKLADLLSWKREYTRSLKEYDRILAVKDDPEVRRQKARVLGWARRYDEALKEYRKILAVKYDKNIELEMRSKKAYWDNRIKEAVRLYNELIKNESDNSEAIFDLSQIYSYQNMFKDAAIQYQKVLELYPDNFRAKDGLAKVNLSAKRLSLKSSYEFFESDSPARDNDIKRHSLINEFSYPLNDDLNLDLTYVFRRRSFSDFNDLSENEMRLKFSYFKDADWKANIFYDLLAYNKDVGPVHQFGSTIKRRFFDLGEFGFSYARERLENNSKVIRERAHRDNYEEMLELEINKRIKAGADYQFSRFSDGNYCHKPGVGLVYLVFFEPTRLDLHYRYFYQDFKRQVIDYFSPKSFSTNTLGLSWRHYLNKEELYFGADNIYYGLGYDCSVDSLGIVGHKFSAELNWDISKRLNLNIKGSLVNSSASVYRDRYINASLKYYF